MPFQMFLVMSTFCLYCTLRQSVVTMIPYVQGILKVPSKQHVSRLHCCLLCCEMLLCQLLQSNLNSGVQMQPYKLFVNPLKLCTLFTALCLVVSLPTYTQYQTKHKVYIWSQSISDVWYWPSDKLIRLYQWIIIKLTMTLKLLCCSKCVFTTVAVKHYAYSCSKETTFFLTYLQLTFS